MVRHTLWLAAFSTLTAVGCATNNAEQKTAQLPAAEPPFRSPESIRPDDSSFRAAPLPPMAAKPAPAAVASRSKVPGDWTPPVAPRDWKYIVIHHSASPGGNAVVFDREHRVDNGWDELGYHFVIDNGRGGPDGQIEVGPRWYKQKWGAHAKTPDNRYNDYGIGICFVGNFQETQPTAAQLRSASRLIAWLMQTYGIPADRVIGHRDTKQTLCPGSNMNLAAVRSMAERTIADAAAGKPLGPMPVTTPGLTHVASASPPRGELMHDTR